MAKTTKKELGLELEKLIDETFAEFEKYLPSPQDVAVYRRKRKEYMDKITAALREGRATDDGRTDVDAGDAGI